MKPYLDPQAEFFDRASVPPQIHELIEEWPEIDPGTARLIRAAVMSYDPRQRRRAWELLNVRARAAPVNLVEMPPSGSNRAGLIISTLR